jgi:hypothetical protein
MTSFTSPLDNPLKAAGTGLMQGKAIDISDSPYISMGNNQYPQYTSMSVQSGSTHSNPSPNQRVPGSIPSYGKSKIVAGAKISGAS